MTTESGLLGARLSGSRRSGRVLLCLAMACALVLAGTSGASAAAKRRTVSLKVSSSSVLTGTTITLSGAVTKSPKHTKVRIERQVGRTWKALKTVKTSSSKGKFKLSVRATSTTSYRAVAPKTKKLKAATSKVRTVTVRVAPSAAPAPAPVAAPAPAAPAPAPSLPPERTSKVSKAGGTGETNNKSQAPTISADGRYVAYQSWASNIVDGDNNGSSEIEGIDVFVTDRATGTTQLVSGTPNTPGTDRTSGNRDSVDPAISADGRYVTYSSDSTNLVERDTDDEFVDVFVWDRTTGETTKVSQGPNGNTANGDSSMPTISDDGQVIAFTSTATNLLTGDVNDQVADIFMWQRQGSSGSGPTTAKVSQPTDGSATQPAINGNGRYIAYTSTATDATELSNGVKAGKKDVFAWDLDKDENVTTVNRVSADPEGNDTNGDSYAPTIAGNGYVAFTSTASNIVANDKNKLADVFVWDRAGEIVRLAHASTAVQSLVPAFSSDGRYIAYGAVNDAANTSNVYVKLWKSATAPLLVSLTGSDAQANDESYRPSISADGRYVAYDSAASDLVDGDTNGTTDIFVWDRLGTH